MTKEGSKTRKDRRIRSIRHRLVVYYSILISLLVILIVSVNLYITTNIMMQKISDYAINSVNETSNKIDVALKRIEFISKLVITNRQIQDILINKNKAMKFHRNQSMEDPGERDRLDTLLRDINDASGDIYSTALYFNNNESFYFGSIGDKDLYDMKYLEERFQELDDSTKNMVWISTHKLESNKFVFSVIRRVIDLNKLNQIGTVILNVESKYLNEILMESKPAESEEAYIIDQRGMIVSSKGNLRIGEKLQYPFVEKIFDTENEGTFVADIDGIPVMVAYGTSTYSSWKVVWYTQLDELKSTLFKNQYILIFIGILGVLISFILSMIIASSITKPINNLRAAMKEVERGKLVVDIKDESFIETKDLSEGFGVMLQKLRQLLTRVYEEELWKKDAEFKALKAQVNPHFLYNTLDTINYMLIIEKKRDISKLVSSLGDIFRYNLSRGNDIVTLDEDVKQLEKYLFIQKARFRERLVYELCLRPETLKYRILKFLIQPLVENSIVHGIEKKSGGGFLRLTSESEDNLLIIKVEDNGMGIDAEIAESILSESNTLKSSGRHTNLGLYNVNRRIKLYYGDRYGLKIQSEKDKGTCISIILPIIAEEGENIENSDR